MIVAVWLFSMWVACSLPPPPPRPNTKTANLGHQEIQASNCRRVEVARKFNMGHVSPEIGVGMHQTINVAGCTAAEAVPLLWQLRVLPLFDFTLKNNTLFHVVLDARHCSKVPIPDNTTLCRHMCPLRFLPFKLVPNHVREEIATDVGHLHNLSCG